MCVEGLGRDISKLSAVKEMFYIVIVLVVTGYIRWSNSPNCILNMGVLYCIYLHRNQFDEQYMSFGV